MANTIVVSPSLTTEAGSSGDLISVRSGAISGSTIIGGTGSDTLEMIGGSTSANSVSVSLKGGADAATLSGVVFSGSTFAFGAGGDTLTLSGADIVANSIKGGAGSDVINLGVGSEFSSLALGAGADLVTGAGSVSASTGFIALGAGQDTLTLTASDFTEGTIYGGGGNDSIFLDIDSSAQEVVIRGDATGIAGNDTITLTNEFVSGSVEGGLGNDKITLEGTAVGKSEYLGNAGNDVIDFSGATFALNASGTTIGGGAGNDTLTFGEVGSAGSGVLIAGGGGADSIILDSNFAALTAGVTFSAGNGYATIQGGAGADSITFSAVIGGTAGQVAGILDFSGNSDSVADAMDVVTFDNSAGAAGVGYLRSEFLVNLDATAVGAGSKGQIAVTNGVLVSAGGASSLSDRISAVDSVLVTGEMAIFSDGSGSAAYLFVQGGSTDMVAKFNDTNSKIGTAGDFAVSAANTNGSFKVTFGI
jgi:hypothetical protein